METPPRMRGRRKRWNFHRNSCRNTPAYAGKTVLFESEGVSGQKHPRVCGEDSFSNSLKAHEKETPPRMRGRLRIKDSPGDRERNTPAYAGKTRALHYAIFWREKHPRVCGEDSFNSS